MTCLDCSHCKEKKGIVKCVKGNWFIDKIGRNGESEITYTSEFLRTAPQCKKARLARLCRNCKDYMSSY